MEYAFILIVALLGSGISFFSGFGFGTMLLPVMALFFDLQTAVFATAIVHFLNNVFKLTLVGKHAHWKTVIQFGIPSAVGAFLGAEALNYLAQLQQPVHLQFWHTDVETTLLGVVMGFVLILLAVLEYSNALVRVNKAPRLLWLGGVFSGFFGGLSGQHELIRLLDFAGFKTTKSFTANSHADNLATRTDYDKICQLVAHRPNDLGQYLFTSALKVGAPKTGLPAFLYRSWPEEEMNYEG